MTSCQRRPDKLGVSPMRSFKIFLVFMVGLVLLATGCLQRDETESVDPTQSSTAITVEGNVAAIDDQTPVDGGIKITVRLDSGGEAVLLFPSLFTSPPPDEATLDLYKIVSQVKVEDHIRATGTETDRGILLEDLTILK